MKVEKSAKGWPNGFTKDSFSGRPAFTLKEAISATSLRSSAVTLALHRLKVRKVVVSPMRGFYVCVPDRYQLRGEVPPSFYVDDLMRQLGRIYYLGLTSSAAIWGAGHQRVQKDFAVVTLPRMRGGSLAQGMLGLVYREQMPEAHIVTRNADGGAVRFADAVLTAFDIVRHADMVGGMSSAATILSELIEEVDFASSSDLGEYSAISARKSLDAPKRPMRSIMSGGRLGCAPSTRRLALLKENTMAN